VLLFNAILEYESARELRVAAWAILHILIVAIVPPGDIVLAIAISNQTNLAIITTQTNKHISVRKLNLPEPDILLFCRISITISSNYNVVSNSSNKQLYF
jgi:hypothetical protein